MGALTFEDIEPGATALSEPATLTREAIVAFARMYDPQPFHLDEAAGAASLLGGLAASGWQTIALGMRLFYECWLADVAALGSPGVEEVRWLRPLRPGDTLTLEVKVDAKRESASRLDRGLVTLMLTLRNAAGETVMKQRCMVFVLRRGASLPAAALPEAPPAAPSLAPPAVEPMLTAFFGELAIGAATALGTQLFTEELITGFARLYDPQPFHLDAEAAKTGPFGGLVASGWQTAAFWMKHYIAARQRAGEARRAAGLPAAVGGPSPGFVDLRWLRPVRPGDAVTYSLEITDLRIPGRADWGLVMTRNTGRTADGTLVFTFDGRLLWPLAPP